MNLNRVFVSVIIFLGTFTLIFSFIPSAFYTYQTEYSNPSTHDKDVADYFNNANITLYANSWDFNITLGNMEYNQSGLPEGHRVEFHWNNDYYPIGSLPYALYVRHAYPSWLFGWWLDYHYMDVTEPFRTMASFNGTYFYAVTKDHFLNLADGSNSTYYEVECEHVSQNFIVLPINDSYSLEDSWDLGELQVLSSYEIDFEAMKPSAWVLLTQLLSFQSPDLGISGTGGTILNYLLGITIWASISILIYAIVTSLIPLISGWRGG